MIDAIMETRGGTHGPYKEQARIAQALNGAMRAEPGYEKLDDMMKHSLEMISTKLSRILAGDPRFADHWADIAGYSLLIVHSNGGVADDAK